MIAETIIKVSRLGAQLNAAATVCMRCEREGQMSEVNRATLGAMLSEAIRMAEEAGIEVRR